MHAARRFVVYLVVVVLYTVGAQLLVPDETRVLAPLFLLWIPLVTVVVVALVEIALWWRDRVDP